MTYLGNPRGQWICSNYFFFTSICKDLCAFLLQTMVLRVSAPDAARAPGAELGNLSAALQDISVSLDLAVGLCCPLEACLHYAFYTGSLR